MAAPKATTSSGFSSSCTGLPKNAATACFTAGVRVEPPTIMTSSIFSAFKFASLSAFWQHAKVSANLGCISSSNFCLLMANIMPFKLSLNKFWLPRAFLASSAFRRRPCANSWFSLRLFKSSLFSCTQ